MQTQSQSKTFVKAKRPFKKRQPDNLPTRVANVNNHIDKFLSVEKERNSVFKKENLSKHIILKVNMYLTESQYDFEGVNHIAKLITESWNETFKTILPLRTSKIFFDFDNKTTVVDGKRLMQYNIAFQLPKGQESQYYDFSKVLDLKLKYNHITDVTSAVK